jgi:hypothetical protein
MRSVQMTVAPVSQQIGWEAGQRAESGVRGADRQSVMMAVGGVRSVQAVKKTQS